MPLRAVVKFWVGVKWKKGNERRQQMPQLYESEHTKFMRELFREKPATAARSERGASDLVG